MKEASSPLRPLNFHQCQNVQEIVNVVSCKLIDRMFNYVIWAAARNACMDCGQGCQFGNLVAKIGNFGTFSCCLATKNSDLATV